MRRDARLLLLVLLAGCRTQGTPPASAPAVTRVVPASESIAAVAASEPVPASLPSFALSVAVLDDGARTALVEGHDYWVLADGGVPRRGEAPVVFGDGTAVEPLGGAVALVLAPADGCASPVASCPDLLGQLVASAAAHGAGALLLVDAPPPRRLRGPGDVHPDPSPPPPRLAPARGLRLAGAAIPVVLVTSRIGDLLLDDPGAVLAASSAPASQRAERRLAARVEIGVVAADDLPGATVQK